MNGDLLVQAIAATVITGWHLALLRPAWSAIRRGAPPRPVEFALASFVIYYDVGLWLDAFGVTYRAPGFRPFSEGDPSAKLTVYAALILAPAILVGTARLTRREGTWEMAPRRRLAPRQLKAFFGVFAVLAVTAVAFSSAAMCVGGSIPDARLLLSEWLGPGVALLYLPLGLAAYYPLTANAAGRKGLGVALTLAFVASVGIIGLGQRTLLLLPFVIVAVCRLRFRVATLAVAGTVALLAVVALGLVFKPSDLPGSDEPSVVGTVNESMARAPVLVASVERSEIFGTSVMEYPGEGYVYAALFFVPRPLAPFKGESTAQRFTDAIEGPDRFGRWAYGSGMVEEAILNVGLALAPLVIAGFGLALGALEGLLRRRSALIVPVSGGALWLCGYHLPAILILFGLMFVIMFVVDVLASRYGGGPDEAATGHSRQASSLGEGIGDS